MAKIVSELLQWDATTLKSFSFKPCSTLLILGWINVLYSNEEPIDITNHQIELELLKENPHKHQIPGSIAFVPSVAGILIAREVILDLIK